MLYSPVTGCKAEDMPALPVPIYHYHPMKNQWLRYCQGTVMFPVGVVPLSNEIPDVAPTLGAVLNLSSQGIVSGKTEVAVVAPPESALNACRHITPRPKSLLIDDGILPLRGGKSGILVKLMCGGLKRLLRVLVCPTLLPLIVKVALGVVFLGPVLVILESSTREDHEFTGLQLEPMGGSAGIELGHHTIGLPWLV
jgi:hypothetical protein